MTSDQTIGGKTVSQVRVVKANTDSLDNLQYMWLGNAKHAKSKRWRKMNAVIWWIRNSFNTKHYTISDYINKYLIHLLLSAVKT